MIILKIQLYNLTLALVVLLLLVILLIIGVIIYGYRNYQFINNAQLWKKRIEEKISYSIFNGTYNLLNDTEFLSLLENKNFKKIFISVLIESDQRFVGDAHKTLKEIFHGLKLDDLAWEKLKSSNSYQNVRGIQVMTAMNNRDAIGTITNLLDHYNPYVYSEAQYSIVRFNGFQGLSFLQSLEKPLSEWQQMRLLQALHNVAESDFHVVSKWLISTNLSVIDFALAFIRKFRIHTAHDSIVGLLNHNSTDIRISAIKTLQTIENQETLSILINSYPLQNEKVKVQIIKFIDRSGNNTQIPFLHSVLENESDIHIYINTVKLLKKLNEQDYLTKKITDVNLAREYRQVLQNALSK